jgi:apolipoprotein N-acyltransferase
MPAMGAVSSLWLGLYAAAAFGSRDSIPATGTAYFAIVATTLTVPFALDRLAASRLGGWESTLIFPMALVAAEFLRSRFAPGATWGSIAYTQYGYLPLMQLTAFVGIWSITFLIAWFASTFDMAWSRGFDWSVVRTPVLTYAAVLGSVVVGGSVRLAFAPTDRASIRVAAVNRPVDLFIPGEMTRIAEGSVRSDELHRLTDKLTRLHDWFLEGSRREARAGARFIVWPEQNLLIFKEDEPGFLNRAQRLAADEGVYLAMGMGTIHLGERLPFENKLVLIDPSGKIILSYLKTHAVFGWEAGIMRRGDGSLPVVSTRDGRVATAICYDADFPEFIRQAGQGSADMLIVPANDWKEIKSVHVQMAAFRAIENGMPLVRPAASGISSAFDPWGRVLGVADYFAPGDRTLTVQIPVGSVPTLYARIGDLFAWLCVAGLVVALGFATIGQGELTAQALKEGLPCLLSSEAVPHMNPADRASILWMRPSLSPRSRLLRRPGSSRRAVCFLFAFGMMAVWVCGELTTGSMVRFLNQTVEQQFLRASQIPAAQNGRDATSPFK